MYLSFSEKKKSEVEAPAFSLPLSNISADEGSSAVFQCRVAGVPEPNIEWLKDGEVLDPNDKYQTRSLAGDLTLEIRNVTGADQGEYVCQAKNVGGFQATKASLTVSGEYLKHSGLDQHN